MKLIHIYESTFNRLLEDNRRPSFQDFYEDVITFIKGILRDPIGTIPNERLKSIGLHNGELRKRLYDLSIITKEERIDEPYDETSGKQQSRYYVKYGWADDIKAALKNPKRMNNPLKERIRKLYNQFFNISEEINLGNNTLNFIKQGDILYPMGKAKDIIGKDKITYDEFDFGLSQKLVKNGYKIAINGDV